VSRQRAGTVYAVAGELDYRELDTLAAAHEQLARWREEHPASSYRLWKITREELPTPPRPRR
jgi:hypothetical protein